MIVLVFLAQTLRIAIPYLFAATGGVMTERAGLIGLGLEGYMLGGAFCGALASYYSHSAWIGLLGAMSGGVALALLYAVASIRFRGDQVVVGVAVNLLVTGATEFFLRLAFHSSANSPRIPSFAVERAGAGAALVGNPLIWIGILTVFVIGWLLYRTPFGLRVRAVGEHPAAATAVGISVDGVRYVSAALSGLLAALGGAYLVFDQHQFSAEMTAGRGFIALAATIFGRWDPYRAALACLLFAAAESIEIQLQSVQVIPSQFVEMIPYVLTIVALAGVVGRAIPPAALGRATE